MFQLIGEVPVVQAQHFFASTRAILAQLLEPSAIENRAGRFEAFHVRQIEDERAVLQELFEIGSVPLTHYLDLRTTRCLEHAIEARVLATHNVPPPTHAV